MIPGACVVGRSGFEPRDQRGICCGSGQLRSLDIARHTPDTEGEEISMTQDIRQPMTPAEFDAACRELEEDWGDLISVTSGFRSWAHNSVVGGHPESKHPLGMARDYKYHHSELDALTFAELKHRGFWAMKYDDWGWHIQGLAPGPPPEWWVAKYGRG